MLASRNVNFFTIVVGMVASEKRILPLGWNAFTEVSLPLPGITSKDIFTSLPRVASRVK